MVSKFNLISFFVCCFFLHEGLCASLIASPEEIEVIENVTVSWTGVVNPYPTDVIAVFSPPSALPPNNLTTYFVNASSTWEAGAGSISFNLLNMRQNYTFRYYSSANASTMGDYKLIATSNEIVVAAEQPMQGHLSLTQNPAEMRIMWVSGTNQTALVQYGLTPGKYSHQSAGTTTTYTVDDLCGDTQGGEAAIDFWWDPGYIHEAVMTELSPNTMYYYRFGSEAAWSDEFHFMSAAVNEPREGGVRIIAFGDSGVSICENMGLNLPSNWTGWCEPASGDTTNLIQREIAKHQYDMLLHIGDIAYAVGYAVRWEQFFQQIQPIATQLPYIVTIGNHEYDYIGQPFNPKWGSYGSDSRGECGVPFASRFMMPGNGNGDNWFSIDYPLVHFTFISTEHNFSVGSEQYNWFENDLRSVNHEEKWIIVGGHRPMYTSNNWVPDLIVGSHMRESLEPLLFKYHVDLAMWGHVHCYERTCPLYNGTCMGDLHNPGATVHVVIGMAGQYLDDTWIMPPPEWSMFAASEYGYSSCQLAAKQHHQHNPQPKIHIPDRHNFHFEYVGDKDGGVHDDIWIKYKGAKGLKE